MLFNLTIIGSDVIYHYINCIHVHSCVTDPYKRTEAHSRRNAGNMIYPEFTSRPRETNAPPLPPPNRPPGGVNVPGYRLVDASTSHLRHVQNDYMPFPNDHHRSLPSHNLGLNHRQSNGSNDRAPLPYSDLNPHHHGSRGHQRSTRKHAENSSRIRHEQNRPRSASYHDFDDRQFQLVNRPFVVSGDAPQSVQSDVLF